MLNGETTNPLDLELNNESTRPLAPRVSSILGYSISWDVEAKQKVSIDSDQEKVTVNPDLFINKAQAELVGALAAMRRSEIVNILRTEKPEELTTFTQAPPDVISDLALWGSGERIKDSDKDALREILNNLPPANSFKEEAKNACFAYITTGEFPKLSPELKNLFEALPRSEKTGRNPLNAMADGAVSITRKIDYYERFIAPILLATDLLDRRIEQLAEEKFKPNTKDEGGKEALEEKDILQRIYPPFGGYYREKVFDGIDWTNMEVVTTPQIMQEVIGDDLVDNKERKQYIFQGLNGKSLQDGPITIPLPAGAVIIKNSLSPGLHLKISSKGTYIITLANENQGIIPEEYRFSFFIQSDTPAFMQIEPTAEESSAIEPKNLLPPETMEYLETLANTNVSPTAVARRIVAKIREEFEYVNSDEVGAILDMAGQGYFYELVRIKKADCDVANFYLITQLRTLGIPARMVGGYFAEGSKYDYTPLAGTKHAWTEFFDRNLGRWMRIDATPSKKEDEEKKEEVENNTYVTGGKKESEEQQEDEDKNDMDHEDEGKSLNLNKDELEQLVNYVQKKSEEIKEEDTEISKKNEEAFLNEYGITPDKWNKVLKYIEKANQTIIPRDHTIEAKEDSTLGDEWHKFFQLFMAAYRIKDKTKRTLTRQSLGDDLIDPSAAAIDLLSGSDDPFGFERAKKGEKEILLPIDFSNDFLLDLTASMNTYDNQGTSLKEYQKTFVMTALYHGFEINQQLKYYSGELINLPFISNHLFSIHGSNRYRELTSGKKEITLTQLAELYDLLDKTVPGAGDMVGALRSYRDNLLNNPEIVDKIKTGKMVKTLTVLSDGNLWCSACHKESCSYQLHAQAIVNAKKTIKELRDIGVIVNIIGFSYESERIVSLFQDEHYPGSAICVPDVKRSIAEYQKQLTRSWSIIKKAAEYRQQNNI